MSWSEEIRELVKDYMGDTISEDCIVKHIQEDRLGVKVTYCFYGSENKVLVVPELSLLGFAYSRLKYILINK